MTDLDESTADDGAIYDFWAWWAVRRTRRNAPKNLDDVARFLRLLADFDAGQAP